jgi:hypothetical protein
MASLTLPKSLQKLLVVGPVYNKLNKIDEIEKLIPEHDWTIFNDSITFTNNHIPTLVSQLERMDQLLASGKVIYNAGSIDWTVANQMDILQPDQLKIAQWIQNKPNVVIANFNGSFQLVVVSGGIPADIISHEQLNDNMEVSFVPHPHQTYPGGLGYVICNGPLTPWAPKFYRYSMQIGNTIEGQVYALQIDRNGVKRTILV